MNKKTLFEFFPSLSWLILMVIPFTMQYGSFPDLARIHQAIAIVIVSACVLSSDYFAYAKSKLLQPLIQEEWSLSLARIAFVIVLIGIVSHLFLMEKIPLWEVISMKGMTDEQLVMYRENSSKFLKVPLLIKYFFNWCAGLLPLIAAYIFLARKKYLLVALILVLVIPYTLATTAKMLFVNLLMSLGVVLLFEFISHRKKEIKQILAILSGVALWFAIDLYTHPESLFNLPSKVSERQTSGDLLRMHINSRTLPFSRGASFLEMKIYRILLVPAEVSNRWYDYYSTRSLENWKGLTSASRQEPNYVHPANKIGIWAYHEKFPESYAKSCHAYSSIDADAYAHFGFAGVFWFSLLFAGVRLLFTIIHTNNLLSRGIYYCAIITLGLNAPIASLQAILLPQGIMVLIVLMFVARFLQMNESMIVSLFRLRLRQSS